MRLEFGRLPACMDNVHNFFGGADAGSTPVMESSYSGCRIGSVAHILIFASVVEMFFR